MEYLDTGIIKEIEGKNKEIKNKEYTIEKTINFYIKSSYGNLNNLLNLSYESKFVTKKIKNKIIKLKS